MSRCRLAVLVVAALAIAPAARADPYAPAQACVALTSTASGGAVTRTPSGWAANAAPTAQAAARFFMAPTGLGTYMLYDAAGEMVAISDPAATAASNLDSAGALPLGLGHATVRASTPAAAVGATTTPGPTAEWRLTDAPNGGFTLTSTWNGRALTVDPATGNLVLAASAANPVPAPAPTTFALTPTTSCTPFPETKIGATGSPVHATNPDGTVNGFADYHVHVTADLRAGGRVIYGANYDPFGISVALSGQGDALAHGPDGIYDVTGNLLRAGVPAGTHNTDGWPTFSGWPVHDTVTHQQVYWAWLERAWFAGERLIVAQTAEDDVLCRLEPLRTHSCNETDSIRLQVARLRGLQDYIDALNGGPGRGWFRLVYDPAQARAAIAQGKLAVVIGVESSNPLGCHEFRGRPRCNTRDIDRGLATYRALGIRSFFITHWIDNAFAGVAFEGATTGTILNVFNKLETGQYFSAGSCPEAGQGEQMRSVGHYFAGSDPLSSALDRAQSSAVPTYPPGLLCNTKGLTSLGRYLVTRMIANHFLIDADHLSERARETVLDIAAAHHYPVVSSHTGTGGAWPAPQLARLYAMGGLATSTSGTAPGVVARIQSLRAAAGASTPAGDPYYFGVALGTDTGGFNAQPGPRPDGTANPLPYPFASYDGGATFDQQRNGPRAYDINTDGLADYGLIADLVADMGRQPGGTDALPALFSSAEAYLQMWQRAQSAG